MSLKKNLLNKPRNCRVCEKPLLGRADKLFCSIGCKNEYHKNLRFAAKKAAIEINGYLKRNYSILAEALGTNHTQIKIHRIKLEKKKFRFKYHTHIHVNSKGKTFHYIYDFAWMEFSDDEVLIIRSR